MFANEKLKWKLSENSSVIAKAENVSVIFGLCSVYSLMSGTFNQEIDLIELCVFGLCLVLYTKRKKEDLKRKF